MGFYNLFVIANFPRSEKNADLSSFISMYFIVKLFKYISLFRIILLKQFYDCFIKIAIIEMIPCDNVTEFILLLKTDIVSNIHV